MQIRKVGVIGAGQMGNGIAQVCAEAGFEVGLNDLTKDRIEAGLATINGNLARRVKSGKFSEADRKAALARIHSVASYDGFADYDLVIESAVEDEQVKRKIYQTLCPHLKPEC
ncbi:MAG: 3-hydroxyacyl-CoA dehydrogenase NAD-binding domain-containing protein, partial [Aestuariivirga sp.]